MTTETVKGFKDFLGEEAEKREEIRKILVETFEKFGFEPAETPIVEYEEFVRGENVNDEAVSDIFKLKDKGERKLALRYELTFQLKRIMNNQKLPYKRYQIGAVFRDEPTSSARFRQFTQCDVDIIGSDVKDEAELLALTKEVMDKLGIKVVIYFNNRKLLNQIMEQYDINPRNRNEVIREIDKLDKFSEKEVKEYLKRYKAEKIVDVLKSKEKFFEQFEGYKEIKELKEYLKNYGVEAEFLPSLARGLSYYNGTVFEVKTKELKETITGGGSYMFNNVQSTGISFGLERLSMLAKLKIEKQRMMIISLKQDKKAIQIAQKLRKKGERVVLFFGKPSKALDYADSKKIQKVIFVGEQEVKKGKYKIRDMASGKEKFVEI
jgi:histidyl-tRNA synthetase